MKKTFKFIIPLILTLSLLSACSTTSKEIDLFANVNIIYHGGQGYGFATIEDENCYKGSYNDGKLELKNGDITYSIDQSFGLKNGDNITVNIKVNTDSLDGYTYQSSKQYSVSGLQDLTPVNIFDYVTVEYEGVDTLGRVLRIEDELPDELDGLYFAYVSDRNNYLSNDDTIEVTVSYTGTGLEDRGYCLESLKQEYTVNSLVKGFGLNALSPDYTDKIHEQEIKRLGSINLLDNYRSMMIHVCQLDQLDSLISEYEQMDGDLFYQASNTTLLTRCLLADSNYSNYQLIDIYSVDMDDPFLGTVTIYIGFGYSGISDILGSEDSINSIDYTNIVSNYTYDDDNEDVVSSLNYDSVYNTMVKDLHLVEEVDY